MATDCYLKTCKQTNWFKVEFTLSLKFINLINAAFEVADSFKTEDTTFKSHLGCNPRNDRFNRVPIKTLVNLFADNTYIHQHLWSSNLKVQNEAKLFDCEAQLFAVWTAIIKLWKLLINYENY